MKYQSKPDTLLKLEEQLKWAYQANRIDWGKVAEIQRRIKEFKNEHNIK